MPDRTIPARVCNASVVLQTCTLFENLKPPRQQLFTAAAALYFATGLPKYRGEADYLWDAAFATFIYNWNNVAAQVCSSPKTTLILGQNPPTFQLP